MTFLKVWTLPGTKKIVKVPLCAARSKQEIQEFGISSRINKYTKEVLLNAQLQKDANANAENKVLEKLTTNPKTLRHTFLNWNVSMPMTHIDGQAFNWMK